MDHMLFSLPGPLPHGSLLVGPWPASESLSDNDSHVEQFSAPDAALQWLTEDSAASASERHSISSRLVFLHQDAFAGQDGGDALVHWLEKLAEIHGPYLPILLHGKLGGSLLVRFFRVGLFDALAVPLAESSWVQLLVRADRRFETRNQSRLILASSGQTRQKLRELRDQLGNEENSAVGDLMGAQESLEAANRQLSDAMAELSLLYRFGRELSTAGNWDQVLRKILQNLTDFVGASGAALILRSAPGGSYSPRQTWQWEEKAWDKVLVNLHEQVDTDIAQSVLAPGVFQIDANRLNSEGATGRRMIALPLDHQKMRLGFLLLLCADPEQRAEVTARYLPFLQAVQVVLAEEVAGAQLLDRIRDIGAFNARVLETVRSSIWVLDEEGTTVYCNRSGQTMLTGEVAAPMAPEEFLFKLGRGREENPKADANKIPELILDSRLRLDDVVGLILPILRANPDTTYRGEGQILQTDGDGVPVLIHTSLMPGRMRDETWLVVVAEDLRETRQLEVERLRSDRLEGLVEMSATLAHEIRNPLMGLSAQAELLAERLGPNDPKSRYIEVITGEVERINETITRMLNYVRPYQPRYHETAFQPLSQDVIDLVLPKAREKDIAVEFAPLAPGQTVNDLMLHVDGNQIKQVLLNLLLNAIDAAPNGGRVTLKVTASDNLGLADQRTGTRQAVAGLIAEVQDNGPGFSANTAHKIFRPFFTTKSSGTGLGLSICHKIVVAHGGDIVALCENDQTVFRVLLPQGGGAEKGRHTKEEEA